MESIVSVSFPGGKKVNAVVDGQVVATDQPIALGGDGTAAAPFDLFLASLATCAGYYALQFCEARSIDASAIQLAMKCTKGADKKLYTDLELELTLPPDFPKRYESSILRAMNLCTVKRHLAAPPAITSTVRTAATV